MYILSDEEEDDEMDFSGVKTVNLQVSERRPCLFCHTFTLCVCACVCVCM